VEDDMLRAYILIQTGPGSASKITNEIGAVSGVRLVQSVTGPYDLIARAEVDDMDALGAILSDIQMVPGLTRTLTCIVKHTTP
jgi:DNA-binding Lrp family transcriptional regulator